MGKGTHRRNLRRVAEAFDAARLIDICEREEREFAEFGSVIECEPKWAHAGFTAPESFYIYQDNGADILAIAHLDTVQSNRGTTVTETKSGSKIVLSGALDDRLGAYVILDLLPKLGVKVDWLLTTGEETMSSTGVDFASDHVARTGKQYKWMFQFDRTGTDVVMYDYDNETSRGHLRSVGFTVGNGSFSDISDMDGLGCIGFNFGVGYQDYHSARGYAWLDDTFGQVARFLRFYRKYGATDMPYQLPEWEWDSWTDKAGKVHRFKYRRESKFRDLEIEDEEAREAEHWEEIRDRYLDAHPITDADEDARHPIPGTLGFSQEECICDHIQSIHEGNEGECLYKDCGCPQFVDVAQAIAVEDRISAAYAGSLPIHPWRV